MTTATNAGDTPAPLDEQELQKEAEAYSAGEYRKGNIELISVYPASVAYLAAARKKEKEISDLKEIALKLGERVREAETWVSVDERLPEIGTEVVVYIPTGRIKVTALARFIRYEEATEYYWDNHYGRGNVYLQGQVTHWKPLPAPPNKQQ